MAQARKPQRKGLFPIVHRSIREVCRDPVEVKAIESKFAKLELVSVDDLLSMLPRPTAGSMDDNILLVEDNFVLPVFLSHIGVYDPHSAKHIQEKIRSKSQSSASSATTKSTSQSPKRGLSWKECFRDGRHGEPRDPMVDTICRLNLDLSEKHGEKEISENLLRELREKLIFYKLFRRWASQFQRASLGSPNDVDGVGSNPLIASQGCAWTIPPVSPPSVADSSPRSRQTRGGARRYQLNLPGLKSSKVADCTSVSDEASETRVSTADSSSSAGEAGVESSLQKSSYATSNTPNNNASSGISISIDDEDIAVNSSILPAAPAAGSRSFPPVYTNVVFTAPHGIPLQRDNAELHKQEDYTTFLAQEFADAISAGAITWTSDESRRIRSSSFQCDPTNRDPNHLRTTELSKNVWFRSLNDQLRGMLQANQGASSSSSAIPSGTPLDDASSSATDSSKQRNWFSLHIDVHGCKDKGKAPWFYESEVFLGFGSMEQREKWIRERKRKKKKSFSIRSMQQVQSFAPLEENAQGGSKSEQGSAVDSPSRATARRISTKGQPPPPVPSQTQESDEDELEDDDDDLVLSDIFRRILNRRMEAVLQAHYSPCSSGEILIDDRPQTRLTGAIEAAKGRHTMTQQSVMLNYDVSVQVELSHRLRKALYKDACFRAEFAQVFRGSYIEMLSKVDFPAHRERENKLIHKFLDEMP